MMDMQYGHLDVYNRDAKLYRHKLHVSAVVETCTSQTAYGILKLAVVCNYLFENEWQSFRTKKNPLLEFTRIPHEYRKAGKYKVMIKVVDILGIDTSKIIEVIIK